MSASLLLPYTSPHRKGSLNAEPTTQPLISLGSPFSYPAACHQTPPLLKSRRHHTPCNPQPLVLIPHSTSDHKLPPSPPPPPPPPPVEATSGISVVTPVASIWETHSPIRSIPSTSPTKESRLLLFSPSEKTYVKPFRSNSPTRESLLPAEEKSYSRREVLPPNKKLPSSPPSGIGHSFSRALPKVSSRGRHYFESPPSSPLSPPTSPASPLEVHQNTNNNNIPTLPSRLPSPSGSTYSFRKSKLKKSQSTLIMPSLLTLLRPEAVPPSTPIPKDLSSKSLNEFTSPSPLVRKCHTMVSLSAPGGAAPTTTTTTKTKEKPPRMGLLRRISSSKSAVFSTNSSSSSSRSSTSSSTSSSQQHSLVLRRSPSLSHTTFQRCGGKTSSPSMMWSHPEHPDELAVETSPVLETQTEETKTSANMYGMGVGAGGCSRCASSTSVFSSTSSSSSRRVSTVVGNDAVFCKLCLTDVSIREMYQLQQCQCRFCTYCMCMYTTLKIREGEPVIECPDSNCDCKGEISLEEVESLVGKELLNLHIKFKKDKEIESDPYKTWCPKPGCDTVVSLTISKLDGRPQCCSCPTCNTLFCASCSSSWHPGKPCNRVLEHLGVPFNETIKRCPRCKVPIERDAGCAQMQCKKCKHVFCWYCLTSLEDDFLLRHYDKGPCKNKLGHSRASVLWHRAQVVILFAGFGLLLVIASPLLLFVGPCLLCRTCRPCGTSSGSSSSSHNDLDERNPGI